MLLHTIDMQNKTTYMQQQFGTRLPKPYSPGLSLTFNHISKSYRLKSNSIKLFRLHGKNAKTNEVLSQRGGIAF